jgi:DNA-binding CsgD family transcriptional regulator
MSQIQDHSDRERPIASDGLTDKERAVLQLTDAGIDRATIAERTGLKPHRVASIQGNYADNGRDAWKDSARNGTILLGRAIARMRSRSLVAGAGR